MFQNKKATESDIYHFLDGQNIAHCGCGFVYLAFILYSLCDDFQLRNERRIMPLYHLTAKQYNTSASCVERAIRHTLAKCGITKTNGEYIFWAVDSILLNNG